MKQLLWTILYLAFLFPLTTSGQADSVLIKNTGSVLLDIQSDDKGILIPRLTTSERTTSVASPVAGLLVYDIDLKEFCYYDGTMWICGWNKSPVDTCFTLDEAYDCDTPGAGRTIQVDAGAISFNGAVAAPSGTFEASNKSTGFVARFIDQTPDGMGSETMATFGKNLGNVGLFEILGAGNANDVIYSYTNGTGRGGLFEITNAISTADALEGYTRGLRHGVSGFTGTKTPFIGSFVLASQPAAGVMGMSTTFEQRKGTAGVSLASDGVWGSSYAGVSGFSFYDHMDTLKAGVHGRMISLFSPAESKDYFGVFGMTSHNGNGVLGIGGGNGLANRGHGVIGISGAEVITPSTSAGLWGVTREGTSWDDLRARFPLDEEDNNKIQVGVLGQSCNYVAIWGESLSKIGVVGTTTMRKSFADLAGIEAGVYGEADTLGFGVVGKANSEVFDHAGVIAVGRADKDKAQALTIHDGAIRVTKDEAIDTPADKISMVIPWSPIHSCTSGCENDPGECPHDHKIGFEGIVEIPNIYADPDRSVILLTPEYPGPGFSANLSTILEGSFFVHVNFYKPEAHCQNQNLPNPIVIHYMIVNK
ncbi:MAG: hypothetical protein P1U56_13070 [Saprospiraceae bacterium]|nr:hypothetical protein [Saprospiraceae bacterium]